MQYENDCEGAGNSPIWHKFYYKEGLNGVPQLSTVSGVNHQRVEGGSGLNLHFDLI